MVYLERGLLGDLNNAIISDLRLRETCLRLALLRLLP